MTTDDYLSTDITNRPREVTYGILREPPSPFFGHQVLVVRIASLLAAYVEAQTLGRVAVAPLDVILDRERALIVQPDVLFVSSQRLSMIHNQVWGAPDLVVEVCSPGSRAYDRDQKLTWYRQYGVREYWLVDPAQEEVVVVDFTGDLPSRRIARNAEAIQSAVLPGLDVSAAAIFA